MKFQITLNNSIIFPGFLKDILMFGLYVDINGIRNVSCFSRVDLGICCVIFLASFMAERTSVSG
jgi:hypothetical protein